MQINKKNNWFYLFSLADPVLEYLETPGDDREHERFVLARQALDDKYRSLKMQVSIPHAGGFGCAWGLAYPRIVIGWVVLRIKVVIADQKYSV